MRVSSDDLDHGAIDAGLTDISTAGSGAPASSLPACPLGSSRSDGEWLREFRDALRGFVEVDGALGGEPELGGG